MVISALNKLKRTTYCLNLNPRGEARIYCLGAIVYSLSHGEHGSVGVWGLCPQWGPVQERCPLKLKATQKLSEQYCALDLTM